MRGNGWNDRFALFDRRLYTRVMTFRNIRTVHAVRGKHVAPHTHGWLEVVIYVRGSGGTIIGGRHFPVRENDLTITPGGIAHDQTNDTDLVSVCIELDGSGLERFTGLWHDTSGLIRLAGERLLSEKDSGPGADDIRMGYAYELIGHIKRTVEGRSSMRSDGAVLQRSLSIISERHGMISVRELTRTLGVTQRQLRDLYQRRMRTSPVKHIIDQRLFHARAMLCTKRGSVESIAEECGFDDVAYFSRIFKRHTNITPSAFRKRALSR